MGENKKKKLSILTFFVLNNSFFIYLFDDEDRRLLLWIKIVSFRLYSLVDVYSFVVRRFNSTLFHHRSRCIVKILHFFSSSSIYVLLETLCIDSPKHKRTRETEPKKINYSLLDAKSSESLLFMAIIMLFE